MKNTIKTRMCIVTFATWCCLAGAGQTAPAGLLNIVETNENGKSLRLMPLHTVVEPNSKLTVTIDRQALLARLPQTQLSSAITERLRLLRAIIEAEQNTIATVQDIMVQYNADPSNVQVLNALKNNKALDDLLELVDNDRDAKRLYNEELRKVPRDVVGSYRALFATAHRILDRLQDQVLQEAKEKGVYLQLGAWLDTKGTQTSIHIPGYDDYKDQPFYQVERFRFSLNEEQKKELEALQKMADSANRKGIGATLSDKLSTKELLNAILSLESIRSAAAIKNELEQLTKKSDAELGALKELVNKSYQSLRSFHETIGKTLKEFESITGTNDPLLALGRIGDGVQEILGAANSLDGVLTGYAKQINDIGAVADATVNTGVKKVAEMLRLLPAMRAELERFVASQDDLLAILGLGRSLAERTHAFTDKVKKMSLDQALPDGLINLQLAGRRQQGDMLTIKLATGSASSPLTEQETINYHLYFCSFYAQTTTGLLFVDQFPVFGKEDAQAWLRFAPSYSILFKGFWRSADKSRKKLAYHKTWSPGIGINIAALNFAADGGTDLGLGVVFSTLKDFLQLGVGVNTFDKKGYGFLGLRIPVGEFTFR